MIDFSVVTPVGPLPHHTRWLPECLASVRAQTYPADEHLLVEDGANLPEQVGASVVRLLAPLGPTCVNAGIAVARNDWIVILNSDDELLPRCLELLAARIAEIGLAEFYLRFPVVVGAGKTLPAGQCFHQAVWGSVGGYPEAIAFDVEFVSKILAAKRYPVYDIIRPEHAREFYRYRDHADTWTRQHAGQVG